MTSHLKLLLMTGIVAAASNALIASNNKEKILTTKVEKVTVYLNGAQVYRSGNVALSEGMNYVLLQNVSRKIVKEKIQAQISGTGKVMGVDYKEVTVKTGTKKDSIKIARLKDTLKILNKEIRRINFLVGTYNSEKNLLEKNTIVTASTNPAISYTSEVQKFSAFYNLQLMEVNRQLFLLSEEESGVEAKISKTENVISKLEKEENATERVTEIILSVYSGLAGIGTVNVNYLVGGCAWAPKYAMNMEEQSPQLSMDYNANVMNQSGEDWNNVSLVLSTADPNKSNSLPALSPWVFNKHSKDDDDALEEGKLDKYGSKKVSSENVKKETGIEPPKGVELEEITVPDMDLDFKIAEKYSVPSDGLPYVVGISKNKLKAKYDYYCVPRLDKDAFLVAQVTGWEKLNLLEGDASTYYDGRYVGTSSVSPQFANDTLDISLGRTSKVLINRIKTEDKNNKKFLNNDVIEMLSYRTTIRNTNASAISILVEDQLPISQGGDIKIEARDVSGAVVEKESGNLSWNLNLKPGETRELIVRFTVQYPKSKAGLFKLIYSGGVSKRRTRCKF